MKMPQRLLLGTKQLSRGTAPKKSAVFAKKQTDNSAVRGQNMSKYVKPIDLDLNDAVADEIAVPEAAADETESAESIEETVFGPVRRRVTPEQRIQPENSGVSFEVGELHGTVLPERWALPPFQYPEPGEPLTAEIANEEFKYSDLLMKANRALNDLTMYDKLKIWLGREETSDSVGNEERERLRRENKSFLTGVLQSHGLAVPTDEQIEEWAMEELENASNK
jgi:hypothetical protein